MSKSGPPKVRAKKEEIFAHLINLLGNEAKDVAIVVAAQAINGRKEQAFKALKDYDAQLGGIGIYTIKDQKPSGIYRAMFYVWLPLQREHPEDYTRGMIYAACVYLEELLKQKVRTWPWERINDYSLPLGKLIFRAKNHLPSALYDELYWLNSRIYNFAKHHFNFEAEEDKTPEHYFDLDEAIAVYLIARNLGLRLEQLIGKTPEQLMQE